MEMSYVLIISEMGSEQHVIKKLLMIDEIKDVNRVWGAYDVVIKVVGPTSDAVRKIIQEKIRMIDGIKTTISLMISR
jgi:DNA-binding Lrp family transcriptional regulator